MHCNIAFGELVVNFSDSHICDSIDTIMPVLIDILNDIPYTDFDRSLSWDGIYHPSYVKYEVLNGCSPEWALPDQVVFSTVAALLHISSNHPEYSSRTTSAIYSFVEQTIEKIRHSTCKNSRCSPLFVRLTT